jgi:purine-binding chemotaxis protein CheW
MANNVRMSEASGDRAATACGGSEMQSYCTFRLGGSLFGTDTHAAKEVTALPPITHIPHAPAAVRGYVNLRGHIVLVLDLNCLLYREPTVIGPTSQLIVFRAELGDAFGVLVERIGEIVELSPAQIETQPGGQAIDGAPRGPVSEAELLRGIGKLDGELLSILEAHKLLPCLERLVASRGKAASYANSAPVKENSL